MHMECWLQELQKSMKCGEGIVSVSDMETATKTRVAADCGNRNRQKCLGLFAFSSVNSKNLVQDIK